MLGIGWVIRKHPNEMAACNCQHAIFKSFVWVCFCVYVNATWRVVVRNRNLTPCKLTDNMAEEENSITRMKRAYKFCGRRGLQYIV